MVLKEFSDVAILIGCSLVSPIELIRCLSEFQLGDMIVIFILSVQE